MQGEQRHSSTCSYPRHYTEVSAVLQAPADVTLGKNPGTHRREKWKSPGEGLDVSAKKIIVLKH